MADGGMIRGYSIKKQAEFIRSDFFDAATREKMLAKVPDRLKGDLSHIELAGWYPREDSVILMRAIASVRNSEQEVRELLARTGEAIAEESMNTFLKLVMKLMNPVRFANKLPTLWERDMKGGHFRVDVSQAADKRIGFVLADIEGFDHIAPVTEGWLRCAMKALGETGVEIDIKGWSLANPGPAEASFDLRWA
jgi:hypothetical protein